MTEVHLVIGWMPYEFTEVLSVWTTRPAAEAEMERLEKLRAAHDAKEDPTEEECKEAFDQLSDCTDFKVKTMGVKE